MVRFSIRVRLGLGLQSDLLLDYNLRVRVTVRFIVRLQQNYRSS